MSEPRRRWRIILDRQPKKIMRRLPKNLLRRLDRAIQGLATDPRPPGCKKITEKGYDNLFRVRVGDWRISYVVEDDRLIILVVEVEHRSRAYRF